MSDIEIMNAQIKTLEKGREGRIEAIEILEAKLQAAEARAEKAETRLAEEQQLRTDHGIYFDSLHEMLAGYGTDSDPLDKRVSALLERVEKAEKH